jgi:hypothetical protein
MVAPMEKTLVRMLSTGRVGTKFVAAVFAAQGYHSFHENLYHGEPGSAITHYIRMLGDMWVNEREAYYELVSDFARPYIEAIFDSIPSVEDKGLFKKLFTQNALKQIDQVVVHSGHRLTAATPLVEKEATKNNLKVKTIILIRNPLKTIHALYTVEGSPAGSDGPYRMRPPSFFDQGKILGAAQIWANTYLMAHDQSIRMANGSYQILNLERFNHDIDHVREVFTFLNLPFQLTNFQKFVEGVLDQPLREAKVDSARNSHIFHNPEFSFSDKEIQQIHSQIEKPLEIYGLDWKEIVDDYKSFHEREKLRVSSRSRSLSNFG